MDNVQVLRWSALGLGVFYGFTHQRSITSAQKAEHAKHEYEQKEKLIQRAKAEYAAKSNPAAASADDGTYSRNVGQLVALQSVRPASAPRALLPRKTRTNQRHSDYRPFESQVRSREAAVEGCQGEPVKLCLDCEGRIPTRRRRTPRGHCNGQHIDQPWRAKSCRGLIRVSTKTRCMI